MTQAADRRSRLQIWQSWAERSHAERMMFIEGSREYAAETLKALSLLNGGGLVAMLGFTGSLFGSDKALAVRLVDAQESAWIMFAAGLVLAAVDGAVGYVNFFLLADQGHGPRQLFDLEIELEPSKPPNIWKLRLINWTVWLGIILAALSLMSFLSGAWKLYTALGQSIPRSMLARPALPARHEQSRQLRQEASTPFFAGRGRMRA